MSPISDVTRTAPLALTRTDEPTSPNGPNSARIAFVAIPTSSALTPLLIRLTNKSSLLLIARILNSICPTLVPQPSTETATGNVPDDCTDNGRLTGTVTADSTPEAPPYGVAIPFETTRATTGSTTPNAVPETAATRDTSAPPATSKTPNMESSLRPITPTRIRNCCPRLIP